VERAPVLLLCVLRPDKDAPSWPFLEQARARLGERYVEVPLQPLDVAQAEQLLNNLLQVEDLPNRVHNLILNKADGNPFFLEEVLRSLVDSGHIVREDGSWRATREIDSVSI